MAGYVIKLEDMQVYTNENRSDRLRYTLRRQTVPGIDTVAGFYSIAPNNSCGAHSHEHDEVFVIWGGTAKAVLDGEVTHVVRGDTIYVPAGCMHDLVNESDE